MKWNLSSVAQYFLNQDKRPHNVQFHSYEISNIGRSVITESRSFVSQGLGREGNGELLLMGIGVFLRVMKMF